MRQFSNREKAIYIAAFIDGEGWVVFRENNKRAHTERQIGFTNTDKNLFDTMVSFSKDLGLAVSTHSITSKNPKHSTRYNAIYVGGEKTFKLFQELIPLQHSGKNDRLSMILSTYNYNEDGTVCRGKASETAKRKRAA